MISGSNDIIGFIADGNADDITTLISNLKRLNRTVAWTNDIKKIAKAKITEEIAEPMKEIFTILTLVLFTMYGNITTVAALCHYIHLRSNVLIKLTGVVKYQIRSGRTQTKQIK